MKILSKIKYSVISMLFLPAFTFAEDAINVGEVQVTALKAEESVLRIPGNVTVITSEDIANSTATTVQDLLRDVDGIIVRDLYGTGTKTSVDVRGFTAGFNTAVLVDGRKINQIDLSGVEWNMISLGNVERIEIVRGGGSVLYGDNANGAVINIITKKGKNKTPELRLNASFGSYGEDREEVSVSGATEDTSYFFSARNTKTDGYRDNSEFRAEDFSGRVVRDLSPNSYVDISGGTHRDHQGYPGTLSKAQVKADRTKTFTPVDGANYDQHYYAVTLGMSEKKTEFDFSFNVNSREYSTAIFGGIIDDSIDKKEFKFKVTNRDDLFGRKNLIVAGMETFKATVDNESDFGGGVTASDLKKVERGFYIQEENYLTDNVISILGYRQSSADFDYNIAGGAIGSGGDEFGEESFKFGLTYNYSKGSKVFVAHSKGYRLPVTDELFVWGAVVPLKAETNLTTEIGFTHQVSEGLSLSATVYRMEVENEIFYNILTGSNENIDDTIHNGVESSFSAKLSDSIKLKGAWTYTDAKNDSGVHDGKELPLVPKEIGTLELIATPVESLTVSLDANYVGTKRFGNDYANNISKMEAYTVVNAKVKYDFNDNASVFAGVDNLFGELYSELGYNGTAFYPMPERRYYGGVNLVF